MTKPVLFFLLSVNTDHILSVENKAGKSDTSQGHGVVAEGGGTKGYLALDN